MKKLYEKSEIWFAVFWIILYTVSMTALRNLGDDSPFMMAGLAVISALMLLFVMKNGLTEYYGLAGWAENSRAMLWFIPLWIIAGCNLLNGIGPEYKVPGLIFAALSMAIVGFAEEMIFRGFLFKAMLKDGSARTAVIVSSVTFGIGHISNLLSGHALGETLLQITYAVAVGFVFTMAFYKGGSLLPCILAHSLTDVFAVLGNDEAPLWLNITIHAVVIVVGIAYCLWLKNKKTPAVNVPAGKKA
jgi:membrane protease YdiL (CAAX protease family)